MLDGATEAPADPWSELRRTMVDRQIKTFDVTDAAVLARMLEVPRERFLPRELAPLAYSDAALDLEGEGGSVRRLPPPLVLARLIQGARVEPSDKVLVVAAASGYAAALLAGLAKEVVAVESDAVLAAQCRDNLAAAGVSNVRVLEGPLVAGAPLAAPFDVILVDGAAAANLGPLFDQLADGGRLVALLQTPEGACVATRFEKSGGAIGSRALFDAAHPVLEAFRAAESFTFA